MDGRADERVEQIREPLAKQRLAFAPEGVLGDRVGVGEAPGAVEREEAVCDALQDLTGALGLLGDLAAAGLELRWSRLLSTAVRTARRRPVSVTRVLSRQSSAPALRAAVASSVLAWALTMTTANGIAPVPPLEPVQHFEAGGVRKLEVEDGAVRRRDATDVEGGGSGVDDGRLVALLGVTSEVPRVEVGAGRIVFDDQHPDQVRHSRVLSLPDWAPHRTCMIA